MNKKILIFLLPLFAVGLVFAGVTYFGFDSYSGSVEQSVLYVGEITDDVSLIAGGISTSDNKLLESQTSVIAPISITTEVTPNDCSVTNTKNYLLDNSAGTCLPYPSETCEKRIYIRAEDVGINTLNDLSTIEWEALVNEGYLPSMDVILESDALVFEYAKVDAPCDNSPYPTGEMNTFGDKGIIDSDAKAWLNSGVAGYCGLAEFDNNHKSLAEWKAVRGDEKVIAFELEVDNWILPSDSNVRNIKINGNDVEISLKPNDEISYNVESEFGLLCEGDYTISITSTVRE